MNTELSEKDLLNSCIKGDKTAWDKFVERYTDLVYHTLHKTLKIYCPNFMYQDLEDIHNSVFLSLIENDYKKLAHRVLVWVKRRLEAEKHVIK